MPGQPTRILARHVQPHDQILICGRPETVTRVEDHGEEIHVYAPDDPYDPYLFKDRELVTLLARPA
jgi:hypothetical protein